MTIDLHTHSQPPQYPFYLANQRVAPNYDLIVHNKFDDHVVAQVAQADASHIEQAISAAVSAQAAMAQLTADQRAEILHACVAGLQQRADVLAELLCAEAGKTLQDARTEIKRCIETFRIAAEESTRIGGEYLPLNNSALTRHYRGFTQRVPIGPCVLITPFNFPLNLVAHKVAPAIAAGCCFVVKPASSTPLSALMMGEVLAQTALPPGAFSILPCAREQADQLITDPRFNLLSFTGSAEIGWELKARAGKKSVVLELGGNAACIVDASADLDKAIPRLVIGAFHQAGQSCISVQHIFLHDQIYAEGKARLIAAAMALTCGDPSLSTTVIGPVISHKALSRIQQWIQQALDQGADLLCGNQAEGKVLTPTLLENVPAALPLAAEEVFGPVAIVHRFSEFSAAIAQINRSRYGLQAGVFTQNIRHAFAAWDQLEVGGVIINDVPTFRAESMPYGGVKDSGLGREGLRDAIEHMTEKRLLIIKDLPDGT